jgi:hypothetical protein
MLTHEQWAEMARHVIMIGHGPDADRVELAEVFRRHERQVREKTLAEVRSVMGVHLDDLCGSR